MPIRQDFQQRQDELVREIDIHGVARKSALTIASAIESVVPSHAWWTSILHGTAPKALEVAGEIRTVDLFSSVGGLSLGFGFAVQALSLRHRSLLAVDIDEGSLAVYQQNFPDAVTLAESATNLVDAGVRGQGEDAQFAYRPEIVHDSLLSLVGTVDAVLAGPPCQGHSTLNNRTRHEDPRNRLYLDAVGTAVALEAPLIIIENVPTVRNDRYRVVETAKSLLTRMDYRVDDCVISGVRIGASQSRKRHFLVASRFGNPSVSGIVRALAAPPMTLRQAIGDLEDASRTFMDDPPRLSDENYRRIAYLFETDAHNLPNEQRPDCHKNGHTYPSVYGRLHWDQPSPTITTGYMTPGRGRFIHPSRQRTLTAHEAARIQGFPDTFDFSLPNGEIPNRKQLAKWIGDAVPSQLGYAAGLSALASLPVSFLQAGERAVTAEGVG